MKKRIEIVVDNENNLKTFEIEVDECGYSKGINDCPTCGGGFRALMEWLDQEGCVITMPE